MDRKQGTEKGKAKDNGCCCCCCCCRLILRKKQHFTAEDNKNTQSGQEVHKNSKANNETNRKPNKLRYLEELTNSSFPIKPSIRKGQILKSDDTEAHSEDQKQTFFHKSPPLLPTQSSKVSSCYFCPGYSLHSQNYTSPLSLTFLPLP